MRLYISSRKDRSARADALSKELEKHGWQRTFAWKQEDGEGPEENAAIAKAELNGVLQADVLIALLPGGYGTHVEIGAALALGKPVILHAPDQDTLNQPYPCVFHYHPGVRLIISQIIDPEAILATIGSWVPWQI
jgi:nucleoside 2-deoxyribosyltransferase